MGNISKDVTIMVTWMDGHAEIYECAEACNYGNYALWLKTLNGECRHIPWNNIRWFDSKKTHKEQIGFKTLSETIAGLDTILNKFLDRYSMNPEDVSRFAQLIAELKVYAESHEDDLK